MPNHPVGGWNGQAKQHKKNYAFNGFTSLVVGHVSL
jgi:hypothetical protein